MAAEAMGGDEKKNKDSEFRDFLGMSCGESPSAMWVKGRLGDKNPEGEASVSAGPTGSDMLSGRKRSYSDSSFMDLSKETTIPIAPDSADWPRLMKAYGKEVIEERQKRPHDDETTLVVPPSSKQNPVSLHLPVASRPDPVFSKWERSMSMNASHMGHHHLSRFSQGGAFMDKKSSAFRDSSAGTVLVSQAAADEGSRTGMKGSGVLKILNSSSMSMQKNATTILSSSPRPRVIPQVSEPECSNMSSHHGTASGGRQMTIFYAGQAHVFDDVQPNKADVIMALAGSSGGSWSTNYSAKSSLHNLNTEEKGVSRDNQPAFGYASSQDPGGRFSLPINHLPHAAQPLAPAHTPMPSSGAYRHGGNVVRDAVPATVLEPSAEGKRNT